MGKIRNPARFSESFKVEVSSLERAGVLNPTLNADTRLFIDPLLLEASSHSEMSKAARQAYVTHFKNAISLLRAATIKDDTDTYWRNVRRLLSFPEIKGTCLGYGAESISGSGSGDAMTGQPASADCAENVSLANRRLISLTKFQPDNVFLRSEDNGRKHSMNKTENTVARLTQGS